MHTDTFARKSFARHSYGNEGDLYSKSPSEIVFAPLFFIAGWALSIANVVIISKADTANNLKSASR
jgi:hypothetical protein